MRSNLTKVASKSDLLDLIEIMDASRTISSEDALRAMLSQVMRLIPAEKMHVSMATLDGQSRIKGMSSPISINFPATWLQHYRSAALTHIDPIPAQLYVHQGPIVWATLRHRAADPKQKRFFGQAKEFGLRDGLSFGARCGEKGRGTFFTLEGAGLTGHVRHLALVQQLLPYLHEAVTKVQLGAAMQAAALSARECEALNWIKLGRTDAEVAEITGLSKRTVKFHIENAARKLGAHNRTHAVVLALAQGHIHWA